MKTRIIVISKKGFLISISVLFSLIFIFFIYYFKFFNIKTGLFNDAKNRVIVVDPGHGGIDGGASNNNLLEKDFPRELKLY